VYGIAAVALIHASAREPRVLVAGLLGFFVIDSRS